MGEKRCGRRVGVDRGVEGGLIPDRPRSTISFVQNPNKY